MQPLVPSDHFSMSKHAVGLEVLAASLASMWMQRWGLEAMVAIL